MDHIYLDHNATTPVLPDVLAAMDECLQRAGNPGSQHLAGRRARQQLEDAREDIARMLGARTGTTQADRVIFTSGGTEANNLAMFGLCGAVPGGVIEAAGEPRRLIVSEIEHPGVAAAAEQLQMQGWHLERPRTCPTGQIDVASLEQLLARPARLVSVMLANNETGVLQPLDRVAAMCRRAGVPLHTDAVQAAGKLPLDFRELDVAALSVSAHKFHGPPGIGALVVRHGVQLRPQLYGGFQQGGTRPGTEAVALAVGMQVALRGWESEGRQRRERLALLRDALQRQLEEGCRDLDQELVVPGGDAPRLPHTLNVAFPGLNRQALVMALDLSGVACSTGSACASGSSDPSPTLVAMGCRRAVFEGSIRLSLGARTTAREVELAAQRILGACKQLRGRRRV